MDVGASARMGTGRSGSVDGLAAPSLIGECLCRDKRTGKLSVVAVSADGVGRSRIVLVSTTVCEPQLSREPRSSPQPWAWPWSQTLA